MEPAAGVLAPGAPGPARGPWTPPGDGLGPAWASSPGRVAGGLHVTRQVGTAVPVVWQCHLAVTVAAREARTVPPHASIYLQVGNSTRHRRGAPAPSPSPGSCLVTRGRRGPAMATSLRAGHRRSPASQTESLCPGRPPLPLLGKCPKPSRNRTRPGSALESPQEGSAELLKVDESVPVPPVKAAPSFSMWGAVSSHAQGSADPLGLPRLPLLSGERLSPPHASVSPSRGGGSWQGVPSPRAAPEMLELRLNRWRVHGTAEATGRRGGRELSTAGAPGAADPPARSRAPRRKAGAIFNQ